MLVCLMFSLQDVRKVEVLSLELQLNLFNIKVLGNIRLND